MQIEEERISGTGTTPHWVVAEHEARYEFAAQFVRGQTVVDCACGDGSGTRRYLANSPTRLIAIDVSLEALALAQRATKGKDCVHVVAADAGQLPLREGSADVFISLETIEHLQSDVQHLDEAVRVLKPNGVLVCSTPNRTVSHPGADREIRPINRFHVREYSLEEFRDLLTVRFDQVALYGQNPQAATKRRVFEFLARVCTKRVAARLNQLTKVRRLVAYDRAIAAVYPLAPGPDYEYLTAVCVGPRDNFNQG